MKIILSTIIAISALMSSSAHAELVCTSADGGFAGQELILKIDDQTRIATIQIGTETTTIAIDHSLWDGHAKGMMTGPGFAFLYNNWFGCIRNAELIANVRLNQSVGSFGKVTFAFCSGGSTPDDICSPTKN